MVWLELVVRAAAIYVAVFFMPLALAGYVWPATRRWPVGWSSYSPR